MSDGDLLGERPEGGSARSGTIASEAGHSSPQTPATKRAGLRPRYRAGGRAVLHRAGSSWALGLLVAVASWNVALIPPTGSLDPSWWSGLYMATDRGMRFGTEIVFTYGPLGFLRLPWLWEWHLAVLSLLYQGLLHGLLAVSLVWALRRTLGAVVATLLAALLLLALPFLDVPLTLTAIWCLAALSLRPPPFGGPLLAVGGGLLGATETLVELRSGPVILAMCAVTLLFVAGRRRWIAVFASTTAVGFLALWFAAGQGLGNLGDFGVNAAQIVSGYSEAMALAPTSALYLPGTLVVGLGLVVAAACTARPGAARLGAAAVIGIAAFALFKEANIRAEVHHVQIFFATVAAIAAGLSFGGRRVVACVAVGGLCALGFAVSVNRSVRILDPTTHVRAGVEDARLATDPDRRNVVRFFVTVGLAHRYSVSPSMLSVLRGRTVHVAPWEMAAAWVYGLDWRPAPVFQDYSAYTTRLDRLNADALRSRRGPQRILRENTRLVDPGHLPGAIDARLSSWEPPQATIAMLCNYAPLQTTARWQVLGKVTDRCGQPRHIGSRATGYGRTLAIPSATRDSVIVARIQGVGVSGLERVLTFLYRAKLRHAVINGADRRRVVPGTAADGLIMSVGSGVDYPGAFALSPHVRTLEVTGSSGALRVELYRMAVRPEPPR